MTDHINGPVLAASLDDLKYLVFEGMKGDAGDPGQQGPAGPTGPQGPKGDPGEGVPETLASDVGKVMTVGPDGAWVAAEPLRQVLRVNYYAAASGTHAQGDLTVGSGGAETAVTGLALANAVADGFCPMVFEVGTSYPRVYKPEVILTGTMVTFRSTDMNGSVSVLNVLWDASTATPFSTIGDMPTPDAQADVGKVPTVNAYGGYTLQTPGGGGAVTVDSALSATSTNPVQNKAVKEALDGKGTYSKPSGGVPKADLASDVQTSLGKADTALQQHQSLSGYATESYVRQRIDLIPDSRNDYVSPAFPPVIYLRVGDEFPVYGRNLLRPAYSIAVGQYTNTTEIRALDDCTIIKPLSAGTKTVPYYVFDEHMNRVENGSFSLASSSAVPSSAAMLAIGDSFLTQNVLVQRIWARYAAAGRTLTTLGTKGTSQVNYEGYAGKKWTDFWNGFSGSPFGETGFDFSAYMTAQGYSAPDYVYLQLGTNDARPESASDYDPGDTVAAAQGIVSSILAYNPNIKILIGMTVMPTLLAENFAEKYNGTGWNWILRWNMQKQNAAILNAFQDHASVRVVPCNLCLDSAGDITDNVHPNAGGYQKIADIVYSTMAGW